MGALHFATALALASSGRLVAAHVAGQLLQALVPAASVRVTARLVDAVRNSPSTGLQPVLWFVAIQAGLLFTQYGLGMLASLASQLSQQKTANHVLLLISDHTQRYPFDSRQTSPFNEEVAFLRYNTPYRSYQPVNYLIAAVGSIVSLVTVLLSVGKAGYVVTVVVLVGSIPMWYAANRGARLQFVASAGQAGDSYKSDYFYRLLISREHAAEIRLHDAAAFLTRRWQENVDRALGRAWRALVGQAAAEVPAQVTNMVSLAAVTMTLAFGVARGVLSLGQYVADVQAVATLQGTATSLYHSLSFLLQASLYSSRLRAFLDSTPLAESRDSEPSDTVCQATGQTPLPASSVELEQVAYSYPATPFAAVEDVTVNFPAGSLNVVVGPNGAGKTTLLYILAGLCSPTTGTVRVNEHATASGDDRQRHSVALVAQGFAQFNLTLAENVALESQEFTRRDEGRIVEALRQAGAANLVSRVGLGAPLGPEMNEGLGLSQGEWQRLAIARALYRSPQLLLLDEPTASADPVQRREVWAMLHRLRGSTTIVVVTHDLSIGPFADRILVMNGGHLVSQGPHTSLVRSSAFYRQLYDRYLVDQGEGEVMEA